MLEDKGSDLSGVPEVAAVEPRHMISYVVGPINYANWGPPEQDLSYLTYCNMLIINQRHLSQMLSGA
jgi:hypothetical protein